MDLPEGYEWHRKDALVAFCVRCEDTVSVDILDLHEREHH